MYMSYVLDFKEKLMEGTYIVLLYVSRSINLYKYFI